MSKKILITSTDLMMIQFLIPHVKNLVENDFEVEIACSNVGDRTDEIENNLKGYVKHCHTVRLHRSPISIDNFNGYRDLKRIIAQGNYDIIWTNEPVMGVVTRLAARKARKQGTKVVYMVHGFHFFKGAPVINWILFYPIERLMASKADIIVTVNQEDYHRAKKMQVNQVEYIHGIGINTERLSSGEKKGDIRKELNLSKEAFLILSIGELNKNKNQKVIIQAIAKLGDPDIHYILCGKGRELDNLRALVEKYHLEYNVHFLGYRTDVVDICSQCDLYVMPSYREGLPVSSLEAMYCGLPLVTSNTRGLVDIVENGFNGFLCKPNAIDQFAEKINFIKNNREMKKRFSFRNKIKVKPYCIENIKQEMLILINDCIMEEIKR